MRAGQPAAGGASLPANGGGTPTVSIGSAGGSVGGAKPDPCTLLTPDDLKAQLGAPFQAGVLVGSTSAPTVQCQWAKVGGYTATLSLSIDDIGSSGFGCLPPVQPVSGVGDEACFDGGGGLLHVRHGSWDLVFLGTESLTQDQIIGVAVVAVSHL